MARSVLFLVNDPIAPAGLLGDAFADLGFDIATFAVVPPEHVEDPAIEVSFPDPAAHDVIVALGARWPVYDEALRQTWVAAEMQLLRDAAAAGGAVLGVCFGGQLIAQTYGGAVARSSAPEIGWYDVETDEPGLVPGGPWFQWHFDRWSLPPGATEVARNRWASQAFVVGRALALQFHPELDLTILDLWVDQDRDEVLAAGLDPDELRERTAQLTESAAERIRRLVDGFVTRVASQL